MNVAKNNNNHHPTAAVRRDRGPGRDKQQAQLPGAPVSGSQRRWDCRSRYYTHLKTNTVSKLGKCQIPGSGSFLQPRPRTHAPDQAPMRRTVRFPVSVSVPPATHTHCAYNVCFTHQVTWPALSHLRYLLGSWSELVLFCT